MQRVTSRATDSADETKNKPSYEAPDVAWPQPGTTTQALGVPKPVELLKSGRAAPPATGAASQPVRVSKATGTPGADERVQIRVLDRKATQKLGVEGLVVALQPQQASGDVKVEVDYQSFRNAYGGDWASRLRLHELPACALTTPQATGCGASRGIPTTNNQATGTLTATVPLQKPGRETLLVAMAGASGSSGDFKATSLAPSASWAAGGSNGGFTWNYDITTPDVPGDVSPQLKLGYSSQSIDGRTAATNNQANGIGDGWSMEPGYIERQYVSCTDDKAGSNNTTAKVGDRCWKSDNAVINLAGRSNQLIRDSATGTWHLESDDGTSVVRLTSSTNNNGDNNGEHWKVTTPDGTQYFFGLNRPPGWAAGKDETRSTWTAPVFGNHSGEPCYQSAFKDAWCQQAWRWNLDAVVDPHGDAMTYYWGEETNYYGRNVDPNTGNATATSYDRGGYLKRIEYGLRSTNHYAQATAKVVFGQSQRCLSDCGTFDAAHAKNWPDVPFDQYCASGTVCKDRYSPSFWTKLRLTKISTFVFSGGAYKPVDSWALTHQFPSNGDGTSPALWLASITRTGHTGTGATTLPTVTFMGRTMPNRVEGATTGGSPDPVPAMWRYRIYAVNTETGGTLGITYSSQDCKAGDVPTPTSNTRRCYPVKWSPPDAPAANYEPYLDWFHSYVVTQILESDNTGGAPAKRTDYAYLDGMSWALAKDDEFTNAKHLTYSDRKGYARVQVRTGATPDQRTLKQYRYFRGIDGAAVKDGEGTAVTDKAAFAGMTREEATYDKDGGTLETATSFEPFLSNPTATQNRPEGLPARYAFSTGGKSEKTRTAVGTGWRTVQTTRTFDGFGHVLTESRLGDTAKTGDEECTTTTYVNNTTANILRLPAQIKTVAKPCGTTPALPADLISTERRYYDGSTTLNATPSKGDVTLLVEQDAAGTSFLTTARHTYDQHGRELTETDALGNTTTTAYTPATGAPPTAQSSTNALGHKTTTEYDPLRGTAVATVDANGKRTDAVQDGLGRTLKVWQPGWSKADHATQPSAQYAYKISKTAANAVTTKTLQQDGSYRTTYSLYDGLLRERQTQAPATGTANSIMTETHYDTRGWAWKSYATYYAAIAPSTTLYTATSINEVPSASQNIFDGMGRVTDTLSVKYGDEQWRTTTQYDGDRTTVIPPKGGTAATTITDALGRKTELRQYTNTTRTTYQSTKYTYGKFDEPATVTDPAGNTWTTTFDNRGQQTTVNDPDKGFSTLTYDAAGRVVSAKDARNVTLTTTYDKLGRKTAVKNGATTLSDWTYDTLAKGQLTSTTRYDGTAEYTTAIGGYSDRYQPTSSTLTVPTAAGALAGSYAWSYGYDEETGALEWTLNPAVGDVPAERVVTVYVDGRLPYKTTAGPLTLVNATLYDTFDRTTRTEFGLLGKKVYKTQTYDEHTGRPTRQTVDRDLAPQRVDDTTWTYDPAGNITGSTTVTGQDAAASTDRQCFTNDILGRLSKAWTAKTSCTTAPSATTVDGPSAYWLSYGYDTLGNRKTQTDHQSGVTTTYTHPAPKTGLPHGVQQATITGGPNDGRTSTFDYDAAGNTTQRVIGTRTQNLTWDAEGHLKTLTEAGKTTSYLYDSAGDRLVTKNPDGSRTLSLPNGDELKATAAGAKTGTRYYTHAGQTVAVRNGADVTYLISDHQGTAMTAIAMTTLGVTRCKQVPFGELRTSPSTAFGPRGFVGGTTDPTGLTHLGAREYDPVLGRFLSVDPIIDHGDPAQMNAYSYAHNNPVTKSDPTGLRPDGPAGGASYNDERWASERGMTAGYTYKSGNWIWSQSPRKDTESQRRYSSYRASPAHYKVYHYDKKDVADRKAKAESKKDGFWRTIKGGIGKAAGGIGHHFSTHWRDYANAALIVGGFLAGAACGATVVCGLAVGVAVGAATYTVSNAGTKNWNWSSFGIQTAASGVGGGSAAKYAGPKMVQAASFVRTRVSLWKLERTLDRMRKDVNGN
ncbi:RHS repeat-associated core domain-containing protein [Streptomyces sp. G1]|uniref:RHS repeat domain-containing protein n=1 Tax=Streptomyces sp. G1 TaxID=361572 RepID=UPI002030FF2C|nr:RHS repeat-associated core domain-containing protein [Streptomyces sp. G1]MCM1964802.1 RHS repeat-associated core domain-containing protein [Streptomyces sp. G1]